MSMSFLFRTVGTVIAAVTLTLSLAACSNQSNQPKPHVVKKVYIIKKPQHKRLMKKYFSLAPRGKKVTKTYRLYKNGHVSETKKTVIH